MNPDFIVGPPGATALTPWRSPDPTLGNRVYWFVSVCKQMRPLQAAFPHCSSSSSYTPLSDSTAPHSLEDGGLRSTIRWGTLVLCLQLPDRKFRQPGKIPASLDTRKLGLSRPGCVFACRRPWRTLWPVDVRLSPGLSAASLAQCDPVSWSACVCMCVWMSTMSWRLAFTCFWRKCHQPWAMREPGGLKRIYIFVLVLKAECSRCVAAWGGLFGMQRGALETFDAFLREVLISVPETWTRGAPLNAWT